jgi:molecular chaperone GrpE (heat shock protein)
MLSHTTHKNAMTKILQTVYTQALEESKRTGQSVSSITYEILEAFEEAHHSGYTKERETQLIHASTIIVKIIYENAQKSIEEKEKKLAHAHEELINTMEKEILHLLESLETFNDYANDQSHGMYKKSLSHIKSDIINKVDKFKILLAHHSK